MNCCTLHSASQGSAAFASDQTVVATSTKKTVSARMVLSLVRVAERKRHGGLAGVGAHTVVNQNLTCFRPAGPHGTPSTKFAVDLDHGDRQFRRSSCLVVFHEIGPNQAYIAHLERCVDRRARLHRPRRLTSRVDRKYYIRVVFADRRTAVERERSQDSELPKYIAI